MNPPHHETPIINFDADSEFPFHRLVPDCLEIISSYQVYEFWEDSLRSHCQPSNNSTSSESNSRRCRDDLETVLQHFKCQATIPDILQNDFPLLANLYSLNMSLRRDASNLEGRNIFSHFTNLVELNIYDNGSFRDEMFRPLNSLEVLSISGKSGAQFLTDEIFTNMKHLRHLEMNFCEKFTDQAIENVYNAGGRLETLEIRCCDEITDRVLTFIQGDSLTRLWISDCNGFTGKGLQYLREVEHLTLGKMDHINCHEAFKHLNGKLKSLSILFSPLPSLDEESMSYLKGISTLELCDASIGNVTDAALTYLAGSIKKLHLIYCRDVQGLSKEMLWHLSGIEDIELWMMGIKIEAEDLPRLKKVFRNVSSCELSSDFADASTMKDLRAFIEGNGGQFKSVH